MSRLDDLKIGDVVTAGHADCVHAARLGMEVLSAIKPKSELTISEMQHAAWQNAEDKGFHGVQADVATRLMLMVTELSEAMEEWRSGRKPNETWYSEGGKPEGVPAEIADVVIRIGDFCGVYGIDLEAAIREKMAYNSTRSFRHGGKRV